MIIYTSDELIFIVLNTKKNVVTSHLSKMNSNRLGKDSVNVLSNVFQNKTKGICQK